MDPSSLAAAAASLLGMTIQITGSLYGDWGDHPSRVLAERLIYELSQLRNVFQSLEVTALSATGAVIISKDLISCLGDSKDRLISLGSKLLRQKPSEMFSFKAHDLLWRTFNSSRSQATNLPITHTEAIEAVQYLQSCLSRLRDR